MAVVLTPITNKNKYTKQNNTKTQYKHHKTQYVQVHILHILENTTTHTYT